MAESHKKYGSQNPFFGKHHSDKTKKLLREAHLKRDVKGEKHFRWSGGSWDYWKQKALTRDHYTCQKCFLYDPEIVCVDHVLPKSSFPELKSELNNLVTLCPNCHARKTNEDRKNGKVKLGGRKKKNE